MTQLARALEVPSLENLQDASDPDAGDLRLSPVLKLAEDLADSAGPDQQLHLRHVLGASLLAGRQALDPRLLETLGLRWSQIRDVLLAAVREGASQDDQSVWKGVFERVSAASANFDLSGDIAGQRRPDERHPAARRTTSAYVGVRVDVGHGDLRPDTRCRSRSGVFGEWGSGKSYFMGLLRGRVDVVRTSDPDKYLRDIRQISFNAWHYADSNLWASLGDEIFRQLLQEPDPDEVRQEKLREELGELVVQRREHRRRQQPRWRPRSARLRTQVAVAISETATSRSGDLARAAHEVANPQVKDELEEGLASLGIARPDRTGRGPRGRSTRHRSARGLHPSVSGGARRGAVGRGCGGAGADGRSPAVALWPGTPLASLIRAITASAAAFLAICGGLVIAAHGPSAPTRADGPDRGSRLRQKAEEASVRERRQPLVDGAARCRGDGGRRPGPAGDGHPHVGSSTASSLSWRRASDSTASSPTVSPPATTRATWA